jgi:hypothetical protein
MLLQLLPVFSKYVLPLEVYIFHVKVCFYFFFLLLIMEKRISTKIHPENIYLYVTANWMVVLYMNCSVGLAI